eukprot:jgi/Pico_ML_1/53238/g3815.t1
MVAPPRIVKALATLLVVAGVVQAATPIRNHEEEFLLERWTDEALPETFDAREAWFGCGATVLDQGHCGSCWAVSAAGRYGQVLVPGQKRTTFGGDDCTGNSGNPAQVRAIQAEIMVNGPVHACYSVLSDFVDFFNHFPGGVYNSKLGDRVQKIGGHCIKLIGWGKDKYTGLDYWLIQNTWSENWGTAGVFRYVRGKDLCGIESDVWAACPPGTEKTCRFTKHVIPDPGRNATVLSDVLAASYGGGKWMEVDLDHPFVSRAKSHLHAELGVAQLPSFSRVSTQVANGIRVRMEVDVEREGILLGSQFPPHAYVYHESVASPPTLTVHS